MGNWTSGYIENLEYTYGYYQELNPVRIKLAFLGAGILPPKIENACELGFGQGISVNIHAAASDTAWWGTDFNPSQAAFARELAEASGANCNIFDDSFAEFLNNKDIPNFDYIALHGVWSWISNEARENLVEFISKKLKFGGVVYVGFNVTPGWAAFSPIRQLMAAHFNSTNALEKGVVHKIQDSLNFISEFLDTSPKYIMNSPLILEKLSEIREQNTKYVGHEFFNHNWQPMQFFEIAEHLEAIKLEFACSANFIDHLGYLNVTPEQSQFLQSIHNTAIKESIRDLMINQQFRKDYWVKGARKLTNFEVVEELRKIEVILLKDEREIELNVTSSLGVAELNQDYYRPILDILTDYKPKSIRDIEIRTSKEGIGVSQIVEAILILASKEVVGFAQDELVTKSAQPHVDKLNDKLMKIARTNHDSSYLACAITGGAIGVGRFEQLFISALNGGLQKHEDWAKYAWDIIKSQGHKLLKDGKQIESESENLQRLVNQAKKFADTQLPILRKLQIVK